MKFLLDSNVLIAASVENHPQYQFANTWLKDLSKEYAISAHSLFESYSTLTRSPFQPKVLPVDAQFLIINKIIPRVELLTLEKEDYAEVINKMGDNNLVGGIIYDAAIIHCAVRNGVKKIVTANVNHFQRIVNTFNYDCEIIDLLNRE